ncbi:hypothetical protein [Dyadobacter chenhuakuii]|nr:hypothetical protein [Dyadobacter chenhuakuii]
MDAGNYRLHPSFGNIMLDKNNEEEIFSVRFQKPFREHGWNAIG